MLEDVVNRVSEAEATTATGSEEYREETRDGDDMEVDAVQNILILSHDDAFRSECVDVLKEGGYVPHPVSTEKGMFDFLKRNKKVDLVIVNSAEPGEECHRVLDQLSQQRPRVSVLLSCDYDSYWNDFYTWLADACLVTPANKTILRDTVTRIIGSKTRKSGDAPDLAVGLA